MISRENQYQSAMDFSNGEAHPSGMRAMEHRLVGIVDDDESVRESLPDLIKEFGFAARTFSSAEEFLSSDCMDETSCLILDIAMPGMSGPELHRELMRRGREIPTIFITGQRDETIRDRVLKQGAVGFLRKPFSDEALLAEIKTALSAISSGIRRIQRTQKLMKWALPTSTPCPLRCAYKSIKAKRRPPSLLYESIVDTIV